MKRLVSISLTLLLVLLLSSCGAAQPDGSSARPTSANDSAVPAILGEWHLAESPLDSLSIATGLNKGTLTFYEDGKYYQTIAGRSDSGTWEVGEQPDTYYVHTSSETVVNVVVSGEKLTWTTEENVIFIFERGPYLEEAVSDTPSSTTVSQESESTSSQPDPLQEAVTVVVTDKVNTEKDPYAGIYSNRVDFHINVTNNSDKEIQGVQGVLDIQDLFGKSIMKSNCDFVGQTISPDSTVTYTDLGMDINQFKDKDVKLYNTEYKDLKFVYTVKQIVFTDGTTLGG